MKQEVELEVIREEKALKRRESDPVPAVGTKLQRGDQVTVIKRMSWNLPQKKNAGYRKDVVEGQEGTIQGFADPENRQVLLQVRLTLPDGAKEVTQAVSPKNLMLTSEYKLQKARQDVEEVEEQPSGSSGQGQQGKGMKSPLEIRP